MWETMKLMPVNRTGSSLLMVASTFLSVLITFLFSGLLPFPVYVSLLYIFSLFLPAFGILVFMSSTRMISARWHWGVPLFISLAPMTLLRDNMFTGMLYGRAFISTFDTWGFLDAAPSRAFILTFYSLASVLFCLSAPEGKRSEMRIPLMFATTASASIIIFSVDSLTGGSLAEANLFGLYVVFTLLLGISLARVAIHYSPEWDLTVC